MSARRRDYAAGALVALIGAFAFVEAMTYDMGTLEQLGPGFFPAALGVVLVLIGIAIAVTAGASLPEQAERAQVRLDPRGWLCITASIAAFILLAERAGLVPATFVSVLVAAFGDRTTTVRGAMALAAAVCAFGTIVFGYALRTQLPILNW
jgi:hypothetical protein